MDSIKAINDNISFYLDKSALPIGMLRSYGDSCLNHENISIKTSGLDHFISFDHENGILKAESGVTLDRILQVFVPKGWFLPVVPGTKFVTLGGTVANDIHGKNHHIAGTFGRFVQSLLLLRSNGERVICSRTEEDGLFQASIGGLGLTGVILWVELQLKKIQNSYIDVEVIKFDSLDGFWEINENSKNYEYTVAWVDCLSKKQHGAKGNGLFIRGNHSQDLSLDKGIHHAGSKFAVPFDFPSFVLNSYSMRAFNFIYFHKQFSEKKRMVQHYDPFFFPLDSVSSWNKIYGQRGFFQYQCLIPPDKSMEGIGKILDVVSQSSQGSFLSVLKILGDIKSPGMMSFPRKGVTLCLDFPNVGDSTLKLMNCLDEIVLKFEGSIYPAKDARMPPEHFKIFYPQWEKFSQYIDPKFSSGFWRRVTGC